MAQNDTFWTVLDPWGVIQTPNPLLGCGLLAISSVIWPDLDPQGVIRGSDPSVKLVSQYRIWVVLGVYRAVQGLYRGCTGGFGPYPVLGHRFD